MNIFLLNFLSIWNEQSCLRSEYRSFWRLISVFQISANQKLFDKKNIEKKFLRTIHRLFLHSFSSNDPVCVIYHPGLSETSSASLWVTYSWWCFRYSPVGQMKQQFWSCPVTDPVFRNCYSNITLLKLLTGRYDTKIKTLI